ncbi:MAG TPA: DUF992 domain-containing protein [Candidatus Binataceae bacterium]|nr:DUF992 domain-containing protein [Candidatus Binataceae bacterium]
MATTKISPITAIALAFAITLITAGTARADQVKIKTGYLTCHEAAGWGFIVGSSHKLHCTYSSNKGRTEYYTGSISKFGADIGYLKSAVILWAVAAPTTDLGRGALAGDYGGVQASVALGVGAGANVLVGGFHKSITLQPISVEGQNGLNVAAGIGAMSLHYEGETAPHHVEE